jgi:hypothetical protein
MKIEIRVNESDIEASHKLEVVESLSNQFASFFERKDYGSGVKSILIICILVKTKPGYEDWFKVRRPKFTEYKLLENKITGYKKVIEKEFAYEIRIDHNDFDEFISQYDKVSKKILALRVLDSLSNLDKLPKKVKDFDKERFNADIQDFFQKQGLQETN